MALLLARLPSVLFPLPKVIKCVKCTSQMLAREQSGGAADFADKVCFLSSAFSPSTLISSWMNRLLQSCSDARLPLKPRLPTVWGFLLRSVLRLKLSASMYTYIYVSTNKALPYNTKPTMWYQFVNWQACWASHPRRVGFLRWKLPLILTKMAFSMCQRQASCYGSRMTSMLGKWVVCQKMK